MQRQSNQFLSYDTTPDEELEDGISPIQDLLNPELNMSVGVPAQPERMSAQISAIENASPIAPINDGDTDIPVKGKVPGAADVSAQTSNDKPTYDEGTGNAPSLMDKYNQLLQERRTALQDAKKREMFSNILAAVNNNIGLIAGGLQAKGTGAAVTPPQVAKMGAADFSSDVDEQYKPELESVLAQYKMLQEQKNREAELGLKRDELDMKGRIASIKASKLPAPKLTEAQKVFERKAAENLENWETNRGTILADIDKLKEVEKMLGGSKTITGPGNTFVPERVQRFTNPELIKIKDMVGSVTQKNLREILGGQFAQKEGEQILQRAFNEYLQEPDNLANVRALRLAMEQAAKVKDQRYNEYVKTGTVGTERQSLPVGNSDGQTTNLSPKDQAALEWVKANPNDPRSMQIIERLKSK